MKLVTYFLLIFFLFACNDKEIQNKETLKDKLELSVVPLKNYFAKNDIEFPNIVKTVVISNKEKFDTYFGVAKTMDNQVASIDFNKNKIIAIITKPSEVKNEIIITKKTLKDNKLQLRYKINTGESQSFTSNDLKLFEIPKTIYAVDFIREN